MKTEATAAAVLSGRGISFSFSNLKNLYESDITYQQFLGCVAQRLLLKQYAAQEMDLSNILCPISRTKEIFDENKNSFSLGLNNLFLKQLTLSLINAQSSKNKFNKEFQAESAIEFIKWYDNKWFNTLKSEDFLLALCELFRDAKLTNVNEGDNDWQTLAILYSNVDSSDMLNDMGIDSKVFINKTESIDTDWFNGILSSIVDFINLGEELKLSSFSSFVKLEDLILPTTSSFMESTLVGIEAIEAKKKSYNAPLDPYNMFYIFKDTSMGQLLKLNQLLFTLYNYMKILA
jgi:hypothetical protein